HRQAADDQLVDFEVIEQGFQIFRVVVERRDRSAGTVWQPRPSEASKIGRNQAPAVGDTLELRMPHLGVQWKRVNQQHGPARTALQPPDPPPIHVEQLFTNHVSSYSRGARGDGRKANGEERLATDNWRLT